MQHISEVEKVLLKSGLNYQSNKVIDDYLLTGNADSVRDAYRCCQSDIGDQMVEMLEMDESLSVLEPGAGKGMLLKKIVHYPEHSYCERNVSFIIEHLCKISNGFEAFNFFDVSKKFDRILINPPFSFREYEAHISHGYDLLNENGIMVFLYPKIANYSSLKTEKFAYILAKSVKKEVGKVCGDCECVIGKISKNEYLYA